jgi:hypothetical protein
MFNIFILLSLPGLLHLVLVHQPLALSLHSRLPFLPITALPQQPAFQLRP